VGTCVIKGDRSESVGFDIVVADGVHYLAKHVLELTSIWPSGLQVDRVRADARRMLFPSRREWKACGAIERPQAMMTDAGLPKFDRACLCRLACQGFTKKSAYDLANFVRYKPTAAGETAAHRCASSLLLRPSDSSSAICL
jgi:hypothetical protein